MAIQSEFYTFTADNINKSPDSPGVYVLWKGSELIYIGSSSLSIRGRLARHYNGDEGWCTRQATQYQRMVTTTPIATERRLLLEHRARYGRLPACNNNIP